MLETFFSSVFLGLSRFLGLFPRFGLFSAQDVLASNRSLARLITLNLKLAVNLSTNILQTLILTLVLLQLLLPIGGKPVEKPLDDRPC